MAEFKPEEAQKLAETLGAAGLTPDVDTPERLQSWMLNYLKKVGKVEIKDEPKDENEEDSKEDSKEEKPLVKHGHSWRGVYQQSPRISTFSGDPTSKNDAQFDLWKYEVECLLKEGVYSEKTVKEAIRKSLRGNAARIVMRKGTDATCEDILLGLETVYGLVETGENLLAEFYATRQSKDEDVASWSCRLEDLLERAAERGHIAERDKASMLRTKFWTGLRQNLKDGSRHKYDMDLSYEELRVAVRRLEREYDIRDSQDRDVKPSGKAQTKMAMTDSTGQKSEEGKDDLSELRAMVNKLSNQMSAMQKQLNATKLGPSGASGKNKPFQKKEGNNSGQEKKGQAVSGQANGTPGKRNSDIECYRCGGKGHFARDCPTKKAPVCWDCGVEGHTKWNCPQSLNADQPLSKGGQQA